MSTCDLIGYVERGNAPGVARPIGEEARRTMEISTRLVRTIMYEGSGRGWPAVSNCIRRSRADSEAVTYEDQQ